MRKARISRFGALLNFWNSGDGCSAMCFGFDAMSGSGTRTLFLTPVRILAFILVFFPLVSSRGAEAEKGEPDEAAQKAQFQKALNALPWVVGPGQQELGGRAALKFSEAYRFLDGPAAKKRLAMSGNDVEDSEILGMVENIQKEWWVVFEFDEIGYVKDDEKDKLDPEKILKGYREGISARNQSRGGPPTTVVGWHTKPNYNEQTHNLEWALIFENSGHRYVNYKVKLLGRKGVVDGTWVGDLQDLDEAVPQFRQVLNNFSYKTGETYAEYRAGDKIAQYGLGALVLGGATLGAAKLGLFATLFAFFKKGFKFVIAGVIALGVWVKSLFTGRKRESAE